MDRKLWPSCWLALSLIVVGVVLAQEEGPPEWLFDGREAEKELQLWGALHQLNPLEIDEVKDAAGETRSVLLTESLGSDPYMFPGGDWNNADYAPFSGKDYHILYMGVRVNAPNTWQIYYVTKEDGAWGEVQRQNFEVNAVDDFENIEVDVERGGWQDHTVLRFRIDPGTIAGIKAEIDYISFRGIPESLQQSVDPQGKLAVRWAMLKRGHRGEF